MSKKQVVGGLVAALLGEYLFATTPSQRPAFPEYTERENIRQELRQVPSLREYADLKTLEQRACEKRARANTSY